MGFRPKKCTAYNSVSTAGGFYPNSTGNGTALFGKGLYAAVRSDTGTFKVYLDRKTRQINHACAQLWNSASTAYIATLSTWGTDTSGTYNGLSYVTVVTRATNTQVASDITYAATCKVTVYIETEDSASG